MNGLLNAVALMVALVATPAARSQPGEVVIRAADLSQAALTGAWTLQSDATSPGGLKLTATAGEERADDSPLPEPGSYFDAWFDADAHVPYRVWLRLAADPSAPDTSVWVQFSDAEVLAVPAYAIGSRDGLLVALESCAGCPDSGWSWRGSSDRLGQHPVVTFRASGRHRLRIQVRHGAVQLDQIVLSPKAYLSAPPGATQGDWTAASRGSRVEGEWRESR